MTEHDDQLWLDALAGRGATPETEGLRAAILARRVEVPPPVAQLDPRREDELVARARVEGLIETRRAPRAAWWALAAAASVLVAVVLVNRPTPREDTVRGAPGGIVRIESTAAHDLQHQIADELQAAGVAATLYDRLGSYGLDADLPVPMTPEVEKVLVRHRIPIPQDGVLKIEISER